MSKELEYFPEAIPYFRNFVNANLSDFHEHMTEFRTYPQGGYGSFYRDNEVIQSLVNIFYNIQESFGSMEIPENFSSPKALAKSWKTFYDFLKNDDKLFNDIYKKLGSQKKDSDFLYPVVLTTIDEDRGKVIDALEHILQFPEVKKFLNTSATIIPSDTVESTINQTDNPNQDINSQKTDEPEVEQDTIKYIKAPSRTFDIAIITAIYQEYEQVKKLIEKGVNSNIKDPSRTLYYQGEFTLSNSKTVKVLLICANQMGMTAAACLASKVIYRFNPILIAMCGIAAGISGNIGDIMIPDIVWDYGSGKNTLEIIKNADGTKTTTEKFVPYRFPITIRQDLISQAIRLSKESTINADIYNKSNEITFAKKSSVLEAHVGPFVSGSAVIANDKVLEQIKSQDGKLIGFDMEAFAIAYAASVSDLTPQPISIIVKSISDFGNMKKKHPDKNKHQEYAAFTSAAYLHYLIVNTPDIFETS
jgi:nucleoside phosphorylase